MGVLALIGSASALVMVPGAPTVRAVSMQRAQESVTMFSGFSGAKPKKAAKKVAKKVAKKGTKKVAKQAGGGEFNIMSFLTDVGNASPLSKSRLNGKDTFLSTAKRDKTSNPDLKASICFAACTSREHCAQAQG